VDYFAFYSPMLGSMPAPPSRKTSVVCCKGRSRNIPSVTRGVPAQPKQKESMFPSRRVERYEPEEDEDPARQGYAVKLTTLFQDALCIPLPMQKGDNLERVRLGPVNDDVIGVTGQSPKTNGTASEVGTEMAAHGSFGDKGASIEDGLFYAISRVLIVVRDVGPDVKNIRSG
jgi:hypothetical protein